ncbi:hypothetical protein BKN38_08195 [Helicobacter sp. CLO-3]|nr:hypothetical protein BA723_08205 [Helicobacter sp. CLO-3]OHU81864.1 hypothetical protein BKN38_08195 [Helicobacter sp. CLO-3]
MLLLVWLENMRFGAPESIWGYFARYFTARLESIFRYLESILPAILSPFCDSIGLIKPDIIT